MRRLIARMVCCAFLVFGFCSPAAEPQDHLPALKDHAKDHVIVQFKPEAKNLVAGLASEPGLTRLGQRLGLPQGAALKETGMTRWLKNERARTRSKAGIAPEAMPADLDRFQILTLPPGWTVEQCVEKLRHHPLIDYIEADGIGSGGDMIPGDPNFPLQWHHRNTARPGADISTPKAWDISTGSVDVTVAVLDTGLTSTLAEFTGRVVPGYDFVNLDNDPTDDHGHGTAVMGMLAASANNGSLGAGVDWACRLMPIKILNQNNFGSYSDWAQGIDFAVANGAKVINLSAGGGSTDITLTRAIDNAIAAGTIFVTITHNDSSGVIRYPGILPQCITVGATTQTDTRASFSNWGDKIDLVAPGASIYTVNRNNTLGVWNGTSFSAPLVAGVCALMAAVRPGLRQEDAQTYLCLGADDGVGGTEDAVGFDPYFGWGRLNAYQTLHRLINEPASLSIVQTESADPAPVGCPLTYTLTVLNNSLVHMTGVRVTNTLPASVVFEAATSSQGTFDRHGNTLVFTINLLPSRAKATLTVTANVPVEGQLLNLADVVSDQAPFDPAKHRFEEETLATTDTTGPTLLSAVALPDGNTVRLTFSEAMDAAVAVEPAHYVVIDGQQNVLSIQHVSLPADPATVLIAVNLLESLAPFVVQVRDLRDCTGNPMAVLAQADMVLPAFKLIASGADWRFLVNGSNLGTIWRQTSYDDTSWASGPSQLGYGDGDEQTLIGYGPNPNNKFITTYFRKAFAVPNLGVLTNVVVRMLSDDGGVAYLNGQEVFRNNMPAGAPAYNTLAATTIPDLDEFRFFETPISRDKLVPGFNAIAVEVHQADVTSSDLSFDFEITAELMRYTLPPVVVTHPDPVTAVQGDTVHFQVQASGTPPFGYRWRRGTTTIVNYGEGSPLLTLNNIQPAQAGRYTAVITNAANLSPGVVSQGADLVVLLDGDGDHIPDQWESDNGLDPQNPEDASGDDDGDSYANLDEYQAGTDPKAADDYFRIEQIFSEGDGVDLRFTATSNRTYSVLYRDQVLAGTWIRFMNVPAHPTNRVVTIHDTDTGAPGNKRVYRLVAPRLWLIP